MKSLLLALCLVFMGLSFFQGNAFGGGIDICRHFEYPKNLSVFGVEMGSLDTSQLTKSEEKDGITYYKLICPRGHFHDQVKGQETPKDAKILLGVVEDSQKVQRVYMRSMQFVLSQEQTTIDIMTKRFGKDPKISKEEGKDVYTWNMGNLQTKLKFQKIDYNGTPAVLVKSNQYWQPLRPTVEIEVPEDLLQRDTSGTGQK